MTRLRKGEPSRLVYSSDGGRQRDVTRPPSEAPTGDGVVRVSLSTAGRGGKTVTLVSGIPSAALGDVARELRRLCGSGGTVKNGSVEIQGDHRRRIVDHLSERYRTKLAGGPPIP